MATNLYYVYVYKYPNGTPFYIGKGKNKRMLVHLNEAMKESTSDKNHPKISTIRKIIAGGEQPIIELVDSNLEESDAFDLEELLISEIGRRDLRTGPLTNMSNGGEGGSGYVHTDESKKKISEKLSGMSKPDSMRHKLSNYLLENPIYLRDGVHEKCSGENHWNYKNPNPPNRGKPWTDEQKQKHSERFSGENHPNYGMPCSDTRREAISRATTGVKKSTTVNMKKPKAKVQCEVCGIYASGGNIARWHNDNCKLKGVDK